MLKTYDVIIVGSGVVGLTTALTLAQNSSLSVAILEANSPAKAWQPAGYDSRVSAISLTSKKIFQRLGVWSAIASKRISPYASMHVWDALGEGKLQFASADVDEQVLGYIIEDSVMRASLVERVAQHPSVHLLSSLKLAQLTFNEEGVELTTEDQQTFKTKLLISADGANSLVRELANIELKSWDYEHTAIVATVTTELPHQNTAWQRFLAEGPLAFLPLAETKTSSIVWSASPSQAKELMALSDSDFTESLTQAFAGKLGSVNSVSKRMHFPLRMRHAKNYVQAHLALVGDAAHTIHPLAGQGVNLGLLDATCLADEIIQTIKKSKNHYSFPALRRYERARKSDNAMMLLGVELLKKLFCNKNSTVSKMRNISLNSVDRFSLLKRFFANYASGKRLI